MTSNSKSPKIPLEEPSSRYNMQTLFEPIGTQGQDKLREARVVLFGCGGRGSVLATILARAGVGFIRVVDRDYIELNSLQRDSLFDEDDIASNLPKAEAARRKLQRINSDIKIEAVVTEVDHHNIKSLADDVHLILDGTDNFQFRFLINDLAVQAKKPWIYGAVVAANGLCMSILPNQTPCLRCMLEEAPPPEHAASAYRVGVLAPVTYMVAACQALQTIKILAGHAEAVDRRLLKIDGWSGTISQIDVQQIYEQGDCLCCKQGHYEYLEGKVIDPTRGVGDRNAVYLVPQQEAFLDFVAIGERIESSSNASFSFNPFMLKAYINGLEFVLFPDGRAIVSGTHNREKAERLYADFVSKELL
jgi:molybdopterin-synthase adenylyltransferase